MKSLFAIVFLGVFGLGVFGVGVLGAQTPSPRPFKVVKLDPALDAIISADAKIEILGEHFGLTEGPVWIQDPAGGYLLFSDCAANVIYKWMAASRCRCTSKKAD